MRTNEPLVLIGHSMGGGMAGRYVSLHPNAVDALVMSSPALDAGLNIVQRLLLASLPFVAPNLRVANGLKSNFLSHDANTVSTYVTDSLVHDRISARLASFIATSGTATIKAAAAWTLPTLLMFAGSDRLVNPAGSRAFSAAATSCVTTHEFKHMFHEIFNEPDQAQVFDTLKTWLDQVLPK